VTATRPQRGPLQKEAGANPTTSKYELSLIKRFDKVRLVSPFGAGVVERRDQG